MKCARCDTTEGVNGHTVFNEPLCDGCDIEMRHRKVGQHRVCTNCSDKPKIGAKKCPSCGSETFEYRTFGAGDEDKPMRCGRCQTTDGVKQRPMPVNEPLCTDCNEQVEHFQNGVFRFCTACGDRPKTGAKACPSCKGETFEFRAPPGDPPP